MVERHGEADQGADTTDAGSLHDEPPRAERRRLRRQWALSLRRIYEADPLLCTCGAPMRILSFLTEPPVIRKILDHLESSGTAAARAPPRLELEPQALVS